MKSHILTKEFVETAIEMILPSIEKLIEFEEDRDHDGFHIVVALGFPHESFNESIVHEYSANRVGWKKAYDKIALSKCEISFRTGLSTHEIQTSFPYLLKADDTIHHGSICWGGLSIACSGRAPKFDDMICIWLHATIRALCIKEHEGLVKAMGGNDFLYRGVDW